MKKPESTHLGQKPHRRVRLVEVISLDSRRVALPVVHRQEQITTQVLAFSPKRLNQGGPRIGRNALALSPFLNGITAPPNISGHFREGVPTAKNFVDRSHLREYASDELSVQGPPMIPMTQVSPVLTITGMGRASTPTKFRAEMAKRLSSARIVAGYATKKQAADKLGITLDRYEKWETGRTPVPAQYVGPVCELFHVDANYLFGVQPLPPKQKVG